MKGVPSYRPQAPPARVEQRAYWSPDTERGVQIPSLFAWRSEAREEVEVRDDAQHRRRRRAPEGRSLSSTSSRAQLRPSNHDWASPAESWGCAERGLGLHSNATTAAITCLCGRRTSVSLPGAAAMAPSAWRTGKGLVWPSRSAAPDSIACLNPRQWASRYSAGTMRSRVSPIASAAA
jgi:hypothetical protein